MNAFNVRRPLAMNIGNAAQKYLASNAKKQEAAQVKAAQTEQQRQQSLLDQQKQGMIADYESTARQSLADKMAGTTRDAASRGMLYSGLYQGQQAQNQAGAAGASADYRQKVNAAQQGQMADLQQQAVNFGLQEQQTAQDRYNSEYRRALAKRQQEQQTAQQLGGAAGGLLGFALPF